MIDVQAREISDKDLEAGLRLAHPEVTFEVVTCFIFLVIEFYWDALLFVQAVKYIEPQIRLAAKAGKSKKEYKLSMLSDNTMEKVRNIAEAPIEAVFTNPSYGKVFHS